jgi:cytochrome P450
MGLALANFTVMPLLERQKIDESPDVAVAPGPKGHWLLGNIPEVWRDVLGFYMRSRRDFGDVVRMKAPVRGQWYLVTHPSGVEHVLQTNNANYVKGRINEPLKLVVGHGLLTSEGSFWLRQRRLIQPAFHRARLAQIATTMSGAALETAGRWEKYFASDNLIDVPREMSRLTLRTVGLALFGTELGRYAEQMERALGVAIEHANFRMTHPWAWPEHIPTRRNRNFIHARWALESVVRQLIREHKQRGGEQNDLLEMLLSVRDEETGQGMSNRQLRDEVMTLVLAGHETVAMALSWTWFLLSNHPDVERKLHEELDAVLSGRTPGFEDLPQLSYTRMVLEEAMRLYPPAWAIPRQAVQDDVIGGFRIEAGSPVMLLPYATHRHPEFWDNPEGFDPERFTPDKVAQRPRYAYFPFGGGPRLCIGREFALMEAQLILATLAQRFRLQLLPGAQVLPLPLITMRPVGKLKMTLIERR